MKLLNPTETEVSIGVNGLVYSIPAKGVSSELPDEVSKRWLQTHEFLLPVTDSELKKVEPKEVIVEPVVETTEVVEEAPVKKAKK